MKLSVSKLGIVSALLLGANVAMASPLAAGSGTTADKAPAKAAPKEKAKAKTPKKTERKHEQK